MMRRCCIPLLSLALLAISCDKSSNKPNDAQFVPHVAENRAIARADSLVKLMSLEEKIDFIKGYNGFFIRPYPQYGIPAIYMSDATQGVHIRTGLDSTLVPPMEKSTAFPSPISLAATWNPELAFEYANAVGEECRVGGVHILLGPGFNLYRNAQCGRNYEYFGEDPHLISQMVTKYVHGIQKNGVMATLKHFVANQSDYYRRSSNSIVSDRALHELYAAGFKAGVDAGAMAVMTSYNQVNGEWTGQGREVINDLLRNSLGFKHLIMTDWYSVYDAEKVLKSGQDLVMPRGQHITGVDTLLAEGKVQIEDLDRMVRNIIKSCIMMGFYDRPQIDSTQANRFAAHQEVALQTAREGIVLLKNDAGILPLTPNKRVLLTGKFVDTLAIPGGSGKVKGYDWIDLSTALKDKLGENLKVDVSPSDLDLKSADIVILSTGNFGNEGADMPYTLLETDDVFASKVCALNPNTIVIINANAGLNMMKWQDNAAAIIHAWYPGQIGNKALAEVISGQTNPSGKLPITIEKYFKDSPAFGYLPEGEEVTHTKPPWDFPREINDIHYEEDVFVGYRWYERQQIEPLFAFGHGLSYTNFSYTDMQVAYSQDGYVTVSMKLRNTGKMKGSEVAQLYVRDMESGVARPIKELKSFIKSTLEPGAQERLVFRLEPKDFSYWHPNKRDWYLEPGDFELLVGSSSQDIRLQKTIVL
ncbi:MAG: glycoside hydrolase family 3 C-terminal domain-containing protein [Cyclobacteriaceae bacterium]|nr:glycoside hydrolase family 3 C-terminal domain-containing protein [Cyclobacteriaceae bacterium HetDA_MAG_MS6]